MLVPLLQANPRCLTSQPLRCRYFLSANAQNVTHAIEAGLPGGLVLPGQMLDADEDDKTLRIAFDFDGVLADDEAEA